MAYFEDPAQIKIINFIPVRTVGAPPSHMLGSYTGLGTGASSNLPTRVMSARDVQLRLVTAGTLPAAKVDGIWGPGSREALRLFVRRLPASVRSMDIAWNSPFYRSAGGGRIVIPEVYASRLPRKAVLATVGPAPIPEALPPVVQGGAAAAVPGGTGPVTEGVTAPPGTPAPDAAAPPAPAETAPPGETPAEPEGARSDAAARTGKASKIPWMWIGLGTAVVATAGIAYVMSRRT